MSELALEIKGVSKSFKDFKIDNVSFQIEKGMIMGLIGQNGAEKTTLLRLIMNMYGLNSGSIKVFDRDHVIEEIKVKNTIGFVSDEDYLYYNSNLSSY